ncbi:MAG: hypothetical protein AB1861_29340 [Cyanobacteriota bacterium]
MFDIGGLIDLISQEIFYTQKTANSIDKPTQYAIDILNGVSGMTQAHDRDFRRGRPIFTLRDGTVVKTWKNPAGVDHIFLGNDQEEMIFGGFVGWIHSSGLQEAIWRIHSECA